MAKSLPEKLRRAFADLPGMRRRERRRYMLYPQMNECREVYSLNGVWNFYISEEDKIEFVTAATLKESRPVAVPASYNDLYADGNIKNYEGWVIYQRDFYVTKAMTGRRLILRFGSVTHQAIVYVNGMHVCSHAGGFLPFEAQVNELVKAGKNSLVVAVDNTIDNTTLPMGRLLSEADPEHEKKARFGPNFDYFNYAGIMRPVWLYTTPEEYIRDIWIEAGMDGTVSYQIDGAGKRSCHVLVEDEHGMSVASIELETLHLIGKGDGKELCEGKLKVSNPVLWEPGRPCLYTLVVHWGEDVYRQTFGFREVRIEGGTFLINGEPFCFKGFGKHEDSPIIGRGLSDSVNINDVSLMKWIHANSFRTGHYPYSEEMMMLCDREGIVVIDEVPGSGFHQGFAGGVKKGTVWEMVKTGNVHRQTVEEMIERDKNHPCVVMWCLANDPAVEVEGAKQYFRPIAEAAKRRDIQRRPVTISFYSGFGPNECRAADYLDVICLDRYYGWYSEFGDLPAAKKRLKADLREWASAFKDKPVMISEYGADAIAGLHDVTGRMFSEEYQVELLKAYHEVFAEAEHFIGGHIWNFADFATWEDAGHVLGNRKGIFTREREPKMAAWYLRDYWKGLERT